MSTLVFETIKVYKGEHHDEFIVGANLYWGDIYLEGEEYVLFADKRDDHYYRELCVKDYVATKEIIKFLDDYAEGKATGKDVFSLYGVGAGYNTIPLIPTPLQQARDGVIPSEVVCSDDRVLMQSPSGSPACAFAESAKTLEQRGFVLLSEDPHDIPFVEQPGAPEKPGASITGTDNPGNRPFVTTWRTTSPDESITIPVGGATGAYTVDWGDGSVSAEVTGDQSHTYADAGEYTISISGNFTRILLGEDRDNAGKLTSIDQWGDTQWESMASAFRLAAFAYHAVDTPDLSQVADMSCMFCDLYLIPVYSPTPYPLSSTAVDNDTPTEFSDNLSGWDVSNVSDMSRMFAFSHFNGDVSDWDVSGVTDMNSMFYGSDFNGDVSDWDVSGVTDMGYMFAGAQFFNGDVSDWDVSGVGSMRAMFAESSFNGDISGWDVSGVESMSDMFYDASSFNQNLGDWYIVLDGTTTDDSAGIVGTLSAQNGYLDGQNPKYGIGSGGDSGYFEIVDGNVLKVKDAANIQEKPSYSVNVTSAGGFGTGNFRVLEITEMG